MLTNFRTLDLAKNLYRGVKQTKVKGHVRDQLNRSSLSVCLNLAEGTQRNSSKERKRFFNIALTSLREVQTIIDVEDLNHLVQYADKVGASLYCLCYKNPKF